LHALLLSLLFSTASNIDIINIDPVYFRIIISFQEVSLFLLIFYQARPSPSTLLGPSKLPRRLHAASCPTLAFAYHLPQFLSICVQESLPAWLGHYIRSLTIESYSSFLPAKLLIYNTFFYSSCRNLRIPKAIEDSYSVW
jgi:hypothetical protein